MRLWNIVLRRGGAVRADDHGRAAILPGLTALAIAVAVPFIHHGQVECILLVIAALGLVARMLLLGVWREAGGVVIVSYLRTRRVEWEEIDHFERRPGVNFPFVGVLVFRGHRAPLPIVALTTNKRSTPENQRKVDGAVELLNQWLDEAREGTELRAAAE